MYDKFDTSKWEKIHGLNFSFIPERYELWKKNGQHYESSTSIILDVEQDTKGKVFVDISENRLNIKETLDFDIAYTSIDRILCPIIPRESNIYNSAAFCSFKANSPIGYTREYKYFEEDEPFACSIFLINNCVAKMSFSFENNPRLIEFYAQNVRESYQDEDNIIIRTAKLIEEKLRAKR